MEDIEEVEKTESGKKKSKDKVRSAWISFAGRIVAQLVGAAATVALGVVVLNRYAVPPAVTASMTHAVSEAAGGVANPRELIVTVIVVSADERNGGGEGTRVSLPLEAAVARRIAGAVSAEVRGSAFTAAP